MRRFASLAPLAASFLACGLAACTSGNSAIQPPYQSVNISQIGKLQFAVGTANIALGGSSSDGSFVGLNTVETFRKADGTSATAVNTPAITGPSGFVVPTSCQAGNDAGTNMITGVAQQSTATTTFGTGGQATLYGFGPNNYGPSGSVVFGDYALPFYFDTLPGSSCSSSSGYPTTAFYGVPPAFPGTSIAGFPGYNLGFVDFAAKPVSGSYGLAVTVPTSPGSSQPPYTYHASASMSATRVLPVFDAISFVPTINGGGTVHAGLPAGATEAYVQLIDFNSGAEFGFAYHASSSQTLANGSLANCDTVEVVGVAFDYRALEAAAPKNTAQTPPIKGTHGQSDVSQSLPQFVQLPPSSSSSGCSSARKRESARVPARA
jgi:hypothetical protein